MSSSILKALLCLLLIAAVFVGIGCAGRNQGNNQGSTVTATPAATGHPGVTATPAATIQPGNAGNYTTNLSPDDVSVSDGDQQDVYPEDFLPTPAAE